MQKLVLEGLFWLPQDRETQVAGTLTLDEDGQAEIALIGSLNYRRLDTSRIVGIASDGAYTLDGCFLRHESISFVTKQIYRANRVYGGVEYEAGEVPTFDELQMSVTNLTTWVQPQPICEDLPFGIGPEGRPFVLTLNPMPVESVQVESGILRLVQIRGFDGDGLSERRLTQGMHFHFKSTTPLSTAGIVDIASDLQDLVSIATDVTAGFDYLHLYSDEVKDAGGRRQAIRLLAPWHAKPGKILDHPSQMAFSFDDLGRLSGVKSWLAMAARHRSDLGRVMSTKYVTMVTDDRLLHRVAALESLHEAWKGTKNTKLRTRLKQLCDLAGEPITDLLPDVDSWCEKVTEERHNVAHHLGRVVHQDSGDLYRSGEVAFWLFVVCLLRLSQAPDVVFRRLSESRQLRWLAEVFKSAP